MTTRQKLLSGVAATALILGFSIPGTVSAQERDPLTSRFLGWYIGGHMGYGSAETTGFSDGNPANAVKVQSSGFLTGAHIGYNWAAMANVIAGIEGDITLAPWGAAQVEAANHTSAYVSGHVNGMATLRGRLGLQFNDALVYATGGLALASTNAAGGHTTHFNDRESIAVGGVVGGGVEFMATPNMSIRTEGLYYMFDHAQRAQGSMTGVAGIKNSWMLRVGASWHFGQPSEIEPVPVNEGFEGFYIGGHVGYGGAQYTGVVTAGRTNPGPLNAGGFLTGAHAGYNWQTMSNLILGIEGDVTLTPWGGARANPNQSTETVAGHINGVASLRARLGLSHERLLVYATGGGALASSNAFGGDTIQFSDRTKLVFGGVVGGGIEYKTSRNMTLRAEGLYYIFDQKKQMSNGGTGFSGLNSSWAARLGASWYFGQAEEGPPEDVVPNFAGFYLGGHVGYGAAEYTGVDGAGGQRGKFDAEGFLAGAHAGYNWQAMSNFILGIEGDITNAPWGGSDSPGNNSSSVSGHLNGVASIRGRLGIQFDQALIYATGGIAFASSNGSGGVTVQFNDRSEIEVAPVGGGGVEFMTHKNLSIRAEGLYYGFNQRQTGAHSGFGGIQDTWVARVGASWHFN